MNTPTDKQLNDLSKEFSDALNGFTSALDKASKIVTGRDAALLNEIKSSLATLDEDKAKRILEGLKMRNK